MKQESAWPRGFRATAPATPQVLQGAIDFLNLKREHLKRLANEKGSAGELAVLASNPLLVRRPRGKALKNLMSALSDVGIVIKKASFDAILLPDGLSVDFMNTDAIRSSLHLMIFVEIKTANQERVRDDFTGFFFGITEAEIDAAKALGEKHRVILLNRQTEAMLLTSIPEILARAKSTNWQLSVQL
jgi:hypothetical protein